MSNSRLIDRCIRWMRLALCAGLILTSCAPAQGEVAAYDNEAFHTVFAMRHGLQLLAGAVSATGKRETASRFILSKWAYEGAGSWYVVDFSILLNLSHHAATGAASEVSVLTNGRACAAIELMDGEFDHRTMISWTATELFTGQGAGVILGDRLTLHFRNYLQVAGVRPGLNTLSLQLLQGAGGAIDRAELLPGLRVEHGSLAPAALHLHTPVGLLNEHVGDVFQLRYRIESSGLPARGVGLVVSVSRSGLGLIGTPSRYLGWVSRRRGIVWLEAQGTGTYRVFIIVQGLTGAGAIRVITVRVAPAR